MGINIKTTLGICPRTKLKEKIIIQKGASAEINYNLLDKGVSYDLLEQVTFAFKQRKEVFWFNMFRYLVPTTDTVIDDEKIYYKNIVMQEANRCTAEVVTNPADNPSFAGYYEEITKLEDGQNDVCYFIDSHFSVNRGVNGDYLIFIFTPEETAQLAPTARGTEIKFEVTLRLNTDSLLDFSNRDSIIIDDTQPSLIVKDSLYSHTDGIVVSTSPDNLASTRVVVRK